MKRVSLIILLVTGLTLSSATAGHSDPLVVNVVVNNSLASPSPFFPDFPFFDPLGTFPFLCAFGPLVHAYLCREIEERDAAHDCFEAFGEKRGRTLYWNFPEPADQAETKALCEEHSVLPCDRDALYDKCRVLGKKYRSPYWKLESEIAPHPLTGSGGAPN